MSGLYLIFGVLLSCVLLNNIFVLAQQPGTATAEVHPALTTYQCTSSGCAAQSQGVVIDANWRWIHDKDGYKNCFSGNWDSSLCPDPVTCATNCAIEGAEYATTYGITTSGSSLSLKYVTGSNAGSRVYLMKDESTYQTFNLKNKEFTFDVDDSQLPCGMNGALYFVEMDADGGKKSFPRNAAGAKYGTGYCDAQCPQDVKFINGQANTIDWDGNTGKFGACCIEMDIWEANSMSTAFTPHPCSISGLHRCNGTVDCAQGGNRYTGVCDKDGCDFNAYRMGDTQFYGKNKMVDTTQPITVVTQFITHDGTDHGELTEIRRVYVQNGKVIPNTESSWGGVAGYDSISDEFCKKSKVVFGDTDDYTRLGGMKVMGESFERGMVLVMSIWSDAASRMLWLDSIVPESASASTPGAARGPCPTSGGSPTTLMSQFGSSTVKFSNIKWGSIGSTTTAKTSQPTPAPPVSQPTTKPTNKVPVVDDTTTTTTTTTKAPQTSVEPETGGEVSEEPATGGETSEEPVHAGVTGNVQLRVHDGSGVWWLAVAVENAAFDVNSIIATDASSFSGGADVKYADWGYWIFPTAGSPISLPLSLKLTSVTGAVIECTLASVTPGVYDTGDQFE